MAIDASIYSQFKPVEVDTFGDQQRRAMTMRQLSAQTDAAERQNAVAANEQKVRALGQALGGVMQAPPEQQPQMYAQTRQQLISSGLLKPEEAPEQFDLGFVSRAHNQYAQTTQFWDNRLKQAQREHLLAQASKDRAEAARKGKGGGKFMEAAGAAEAKAYVAGQKVGQGSQETVDQLDDSLKGLLDYEKKSTFGTGPVATVGGLTSYFSKDAENLDRKFKGVALEKMKRQFAGMSKAIDSDAERRFFLAAEPSLTNRPETNANIILAGKSLALKQKAEAEAQRAYVEQNGDLAGYRSPVMGQVTAVVGPDGEMRLIPISDKRAAINQGFQTIDQYASSLFGEGGNQSSGAINDAVAAPPKIRPGHEQGGYIYMGGDPGDQKSWKRAR